MRDFFEVLMDLGIYKKTQHNKSENLYRFQNNSMVEFFSVDDEQKLRGRRRDILWCNEANEITFEQFQQLNMRTTTKLFFDFNPSDNYHWLYDLLERPESVKIHSTYKDNPFLPASLIREYDNLHQIDEGFYRIYSLGERATTKTTIFTNWSEFSEPFPSTKETIYGLDFGFTAPTALIECNFHDNFCYVRELIYEKSLTSNDLIQKLKTLNISKNKEMVCDSARPEIIEDLRRNGFNARNANKSIIDGINSVKLYKLLIESESVNLIKELKNYKWKTNGDLILDEPVKIWDHGIDALRYAIHSYKLKNTLTDKSFYRIKF